MSIATRLMLALVAALFICTSSYAEGVGGKAKVKADQQDPFALPPVVASQWTGCFVSADAGVAAAIADPILGVDGYIYGLGIGCNVQLNRIVLGAFLDHQWGSMEAFGSTLSVRELAFGGRAGALLTDNVLLYGALSRPRLSVKGMDFDGLGVGGGIEAVIAGGWSADLRYMRNTYDDLDSLREHQIRLGINVKLNGILPK